MEVGILGATGPAGQAVATRLAAVGVDVVLGSRSQERANEACDGIRKKWPDRDLPITPGTNEQAAGAGLVIVATPWDGAAPTAAALATRLDGKVVISMANALVKVDGELRPFVPDEGSVAVAVQKAVPGALVTAAFHHLPARSLADIAKPLAADVLVCADRPEAFETTADLVRRIPELRPLHAGSLAMAAAVEEFTAVLLEVNRRYKLRATVRLTGAH